MDIITSGSWVDNFLLLSAYSDNPIISEGSPCCSVAQPQAVNVLLLKCSKGVPIKRNLRFPCNEVILKHIWVFRFFLWPAWMLVFGISKAPPPCPSYRTFTWSVPLADSAFTQHMAGPMGHCFKLSDCFFLPFFSPLAMTLAIRTFLSPNKIFLSTRLLFQVQTGKGPGITL